MRLKKGDLWLLGTIVALLAIFLAAPQIYVNQAFFLTMIIYAILATALNIIYGYTGYLPFGFAVFFAIGAYGFGIGVRFHYSVAVSLLFGMLASVLLSFIFIPLLRLRGVFFSIATLGAFELIYYVVENPALSRYTGGPLGLSLTQVYNPNEVYYISAALLIAAVIISYFIKHSRFGLALRAIRDDLTSASTSGINVSLFRNIAWWVTAAIAGFAGALYGWYIVFFYPSDVFSITITLYAIVFLIFGGKDSIIGPLLGTMVLYSMYYGIGLTYPLYFYTAFGIMIVVLILFIPNGVVSLIRKTVAKELI